jgi:alpha-L-fucosidase
MPRPAPIHFTHTKTKNMKKTTLTLAAIGLLASIHAHAAETTAPATSPATETPTYLKQNKSAEAPVATPAPDDLPRETEEQRDARMAWWRDARFGMFIHWGVYARLGGIYDGKEIPSLGEQIMGRGEIPVAKYKELAKEFNPTKYNPEDWVLMAKKAGMKYIVITAKHVDGFALWPTATNDWDVESTAYKKDLLKPLAEACKKHGIKLGFYYAQTVDWSNGGACNNWDPAGADDIPNYMKNIAIPQIKELANNYGDAPAILWWDVPVAMNLDYAKQILDVLSVRPNLIQNNRLYKMHGHMGVIDMAALEEIKGNPLYGDTETPEQYIPPNGLGDRDFEVCMTMNDTWGYKSTDHNWKSAKTLIHQLIDIASKGGNYLLNVGPTGEGLFPEPIVERLDVIGKWMAVNSESIYGTTHSPFAKLIWGRCTVKKHEGGTTLFLHVFDWPKDGKLLVPGLESKVKSARLLANGTKLKFEQTPEGVLIQVPKQALDADATVIKLEIVGEPKVSKVFIKPGKDGSIELPAALADFPAPAKGGTPRFQEGEAGNEIGFWDNAEAPVSWEFAGAKPGEYEVLAEVSGIKDAKAIVEFGDQKLNPSLSSTVNYIKYNTQSLGKIRIAGEGDQSLVIRPDPTDWTAFNLRKVTLRPLSAQ